MLISISVYAVWSLGTCLRPDEDLQEIPFTEMELQGADSIEFSNNCNHLMHRIFFS